MRPFNESLYVRRKEGNKILLNSIWNKIYNWTKSKTRTEIEESTKPTKIYKVSLDAHLDHSNRKFEKPSIILKRCEGARGILYMNETSNHLYLPHSVLKRTRIIEVKNVSMKIRVYDGEVANQLIYLENILGFLKEVD